MVVFVFVLFCCFCLFCFLFLFLSNLLGELIGFITCNL